MKIRFGKNDVLDSKGVMGDATPSIEKGLLLALYDAVSRKSGNDTASNWDAVTGYKRLDLMNILEGKINEFLDEASQASGE